MTMPPFASARAQAMLDICRIMFREFSQTQNWDTEQMARAHAALPDFVRWCREQNLPERDAAAFAEIGIDPADVATVSEYLINADDFQSCLRLQPMWSAITNCRTPLKPALLYTRLELICGFEDGRMFKLTVPTHLPDDKRCREGFLVALLEEQVGCLIYLLRETGFRAMVDKYGQYADDQD